MNISVCCPSYRRSYVETLEYLPFCRVYVDGSEYEDYVKSNPEGSNIIRCQDGVQGNLCRVRNYILDQEFGSGMDVVLIIDDDLKGVYFWEKKKAKLVTKEMFIPFLEKYSLQTMEIGAYFWGINLNMDKQVYREYTPFSTISYIGGPFQCFIRGGVIRYDEKLPLKEDYDMTLQQLNRYRVVFRVNKYYYVAKQSEQKGGCASYRNIEREIEQLEALQKKWGSKIVKIDSSNRSHNLKKKKKTIDYNPIIHVPIKGV